MNKREWMLQAAIAGLSGGFGPIDTGELGTLYDAIVAASPEPADEGWIEHRGEKPYPEGRVDVKFRSGAILEGEDADEWVWNWEYGDEDAGDIIAWRPAT